MQIRVQQDGIIIGTADIDHLDPPMGVAFGPFFPSDRYDRRRHANVIEGNYEGDKGQLLSVHSDHHDCLTITSIAIEDWDDPEVGRHLTIWFQDAADFAALFSAHSDYRAYYGQ